MHSPLAHGGICGLALMMSHLLRRRARGWLAAGVLLATFGWSWTPSTQAGCSHYATTKTDAARSHTVSPGVLFSAATAPGDDWRAAPLDQPPSRPCSGFRCSGDSSSPPVGMPQAVPRIDAWGFILLQGQRPGLTSSLLREEEESPHSLDRAERVPRPPR